MIDRGKSRWLLSALLIFFCIQFVVALLAGKLAVTGHEVDVLHAADAVLRMAGGDLQHIDFMTPLGVMTFAPVALLVSAGLALGPAFLFANLLVLLGLLPFIYWVASSRFQGTIGIVFALAVALMTTAVVYGGEEATVSISMYYNRWGWAAVFLICTMLILPNQSSRQNGVIDAVTLGVLLGYLALLKATFFITMAPLVLLALLIDKEWRQIIICGATGLVVAIVATMIFGGLAFWQAYVADMLFVSGSQVRPRPGKEFLEILGSPAFLPGTFCLLISIIGLRKLGHQRDGLLLFAAAPAFLYITYQNWGNDVKWLFLLGMLSLVWSRRETDKNIFGVPAKNFFGLISAVSMALVFPSFVNMTVSPFRNLTADTDNYIEAIKHPGDAGLWIERKRSFTAEAMISRDILPDPKSDEEAVALKTLGGVEMANCALKNGYLGTMLTIAADLKEIGLGDKSLAFVDVTNPLSLISDAKRLKKAAPWYYGGTTEAEAADHLIVPKCPISRVTFEAYIDDLNASDLDWQMVEERPHYWVFSPR